MHISTEVTQWLYDFHLVCLCGAVRSSLVWTSLMHPVMCSHPACVIMGRHIRSGAAQWLPWEPLNIPRKLPEMAIKWNYYYLFRGLVRGFVCLFVYLFVFVFCKGRQGFKGGLKKGTRGRRGRRVERLVMKAVFLKETKSHRCDQLLCSKCISHCKCRPPNEVQFINNWHCWL